MVLHIYLYVSESYLRIKWSTNWQRNYLLLNQAHL